MFTSPFTQSQQFVDAWNQLSAEHVARMEAMTAQYEEMRRLSIARMTEAVDESARLFKESIAYATTLSDEWRKIALEATKKAAQNASTKA
jgi:hypothetical protein